MKVEAVYMDIIKAFDKVFRCRLNQRVGYPRRVSKLNWFSDGKERVVEGGCFQIGSL